MPVGATSITKKRHISGETKNDISMRSFYKLNFLGTFIEVMVLNFVL